MEKRSSRRIVVGYKAEIMYDGRVYECVMENLSSTGAYIITSVTKAETVFMTNETVELKFESGPTERLNLQCRIKWTEKIPPHRLTNRIGLEIINPFWEQSAFFL